MEQALAATTRHGGMRHRFRRGVVAVAVSALTVALVATAAPASAAPASLTEATCAGTYTAAKGVRTCTVQSGNVTYSEDLVNYKEVSLGGGAFIFGYWREYLGTRVVTVQTQQKGKITTVTDTVIVRRDITDQTCSIYNGTTVNVAISECEAAGIYPAPIVLGG